MAHTQPRSTAWREGQLAAVGGALYGCTHTISGHPLDNVRSPPSAERCHTLFVARQVKAAMQLDTRYRGLGALDTARAMWRSGVRTFFRGCIPPMWGSAVYRSVMMSTYEASFTALDGVDQASPVGALLHAEVAGVRPFVVASAVLCSTARSVVEGPIEYAKVMGQTGRSWVLADVYRGMSMQVLRTTAMLCFIFVPYDICRRYTTWFSTLSGQCIVVTSICAFSYAVCWPFETLKNLAQARHSLVALPSPICARAPFFFVQAGRPHPGATIVERVAFLGGVRGLYIGSGPGIICGGSRNGCAMLVMAKYHEMASSWGLRD